MSGLSINTNIPAARAGEAFGRADRVMGQVLERLATGKRINRASDDPAGLIAVNRLEGSEVELTNKIQALQRRQVQSGTMEGALSVVSDLLTSLNGLVVTAGSGSTLDEGARTGLREEIDSVVKTLDHLARSGTNAQGAKLFADGTLANYASNNLGRVTIERDGKKISASVYELRSSGAFDPLNDAEGAQQIVSAALSQVNGARAGYGADAKSIDAQVAAAQVELENTLAAKGLILDTDYAEETARLVRTQVQQQAALYARQLATQQRADAVLKLLGDAAEPSKRA
jgi:flagellin